VLLGNTGEGTISSERISRAIRKARRDSTVKAIVLRVNSGGGGALASEVIYREALLASEAKPLVASIGDVGASAAYYIIAPADTVLASPNSITGSIGVFAMLPNVQPFFNKKLGINIDVAKTNKHADVGTPFRPLSEEEKDIIYNMVERTYDSFVAGVSSGRDMTKQQVNAIGGGRVWSGEDALENGLIDMYGGLNDAIKIAGEMADLEKYRVTSLPVLEDPLDVFIRELTENTRARMIQNELGEFYKYFKSVSELENLFGVQGRIPYMFEIH
jgi:protease-4